MLKSFRLLVAFLLLSKAYVVAEISAHNIQLIDDIYALLEPGEVVTNLYEIEGGFANHLWYVETLQGEYVLRYPRKSEDVEVFKRSLEISQKVFQYGLTPRPVGVNVDKQQIMLDFVATTPWPIYEEDNQPYIATMKALKLFHGCLNHSFSSESVIGWAPFTSIFKEGERLLASPYLPVHFSVAYQRCLRIFASLEQWLEHHATFCHGDFHKGNVLLKRETSQSLFIDFDTVALGHPFFDIAKFTVALDRVSRLKLLKAYLEREPHDLDLAHFELIDLSLLMVVAAVRFNSVLAKESCLTKEEMEALLDCSDHLPSFVSIPFGDQSVKMRQLGALYALNEFLRRTEGEAFEGLLQLVASFR